MLLKHLSIGDPVVLFDEKAGAYVGRVLVGKRERTAEAVLDQPVSFQRQGTVQRGRVVPRKKIIAQGVAG